MSGKFFQIDRDVFKHVTALGLNPAVAYLVLACGTGGDNRTSAWSVNAIEKYTGIGRSLAHRSIDALIEAGAVTRTQGGTKPRYILEGLYDIPSLHLDFSLPAQHEIETPWIWLPNSLVVGAAGETTPLERIRGLQEVRSLRQFIGLYHQHNLVENGGLHWRDIRQTYKRELITSRGKWNVWAFSAGNAESWIAKPLWAEFRKGIRNDAGRDLGNDDFWNSWRALKRLGLIECVPHLVEADTDEAALILPCPDEQDNGTPDEKAVGDAVRRAGFAMLENSLPHRLRTDDQIIPVLDRFPKVEMVGIYRLRYRPQTAKTAAWIAKADEYEDWRKLYSSLF